MTLSVRRGWPDGRPRALSFLPSFLFTDATSAWRYILMGWPLVALPTLLLGWLSFKLLPGLVGPTINGQVPLWVSALLVVVISPFCETLLMTVPVILLDRWRGPLVAVIGSALLWGVAHSLAAARWGLVIWWPFLLFSIAYLTWRGVGYWRAVGMVFSLHALNNAVPIAAVLVASRWR